MRRSVRIERRPPLGDTIRNSCETVDITSYLASEGGSNDFLDAGDGVELYIVLEGGCVLGRCFARIGYCVSQVFVDTECGGGIVSVYGGVDEDVAIECGV